MAITLNGDAGVTAPTVSDSYGDLRKIDIVVLSGAFTATLANLGSCLSINGTLIIPLNVFSAGDYFYIYNRTGGEISYTPTPGVTIVRSGTTDVGTRPIANYGFVQMVCIASNSFVAFGNIN